MTRVLVLAPCPFLPARGGGEIRALEIWSRLARWDDVGIVFAWRPSEAEGAAAMRERFPGSVGVERNGLGPGPAAVGTAVRAALTGLPWTAARLASARTTAAVLREARRRRPEAVVAEFLHVAPYLALAGPAARVLHAHNVEGQIARRAAGVAEDLPRRLAWSLQARRTERMERRAARGADLVVAVSWEDARAFEGMGARRVAVVPHGVDAGLADLPGVEGPGDPDRVVFVGALDWRGNLDGLRWFIGDVWPRVRARRPGAVLAVVGRRPGGEARALGGPGVEWVGEVEDVTPWRLRARVEVIPLRVAGGARLKLLEALATGRATVSTAVGAEGTPVRDGREALVADGAEDFAGAVLRCLADDALRDRLGTAGRAFARDRTWDAAAEAMRDALGEAVEARSG